MYKSELKKVQVDGFALNSARKNDQIKILQEAFLTSFDSKHVKMMNKAVGLFADASIGLNSLLVVIREDVARIYKDFPITLDVRLKTDVKKFQAVFKDQVLDIEGLNFKDDRFEVEIKDHDKILLLFRKDFSFGVYFDFSGSLKKSKLSLKLGRCYRNLEYYETYKYFQESNNSKELLSHGWFPFIQILGDDLERLISSNEIDIEINTELLIDRFDKQRIESFTQYWWSNPVFGKKREVIEAGIVAFLENTNAGNINAIKNLLLEIEGVIRLSFHYESNEYPKTDKLKRFLIAKAKERFASDDSFGFANLFSEYLDDVIFKEFRLEGGKIEFSRHSIGHGVAGKHLFTRARALQCILTLDQIYFYLNREELRFEKEAKVE